MTETSSTKPLSAFALFAGLPAESLDRLTPQFRPRRLVPGELLIARDDASDDIFFVLRGRLRVIMYSSDGRAIPFRELGPGESLGELAAIDRLPRSASVEAVQDTEILAFPGAAFRALVREEASVANAVLRTAIGYIRDLSERLYELRSLDSTARIRREIVRLARETESVGASATISPAPRQSDIADRAGSHREAVAREFGRLARMGLIERRGRILVVKDINRLAILAEGAAGGASR